MMHVLMSHSIHVGCNLLQFASIFFERFYFILFKMMEKKTFLTTVLFFFLNSYSPHPSNSHTIITGLAARY